MYFYILKHCTMVPIIPLACIWGFFCRCKTVYIKLSDMSWKLLCIFFMSQTRYMFFLEKVHHLSCKNFLLENFASVVFFYKRIYITIIITCTYDSVFWQFLRMSWIWKSLSFVCMNSLNYFFYQVYIAVWLHTFINCSLFTFVFISFPNFLWFKKCMQGHVQKRLIWKTSKEFNVYINSEVKCI